MRIPRDLEPLVDQGGEEEILLFAVVACVGEEPDEADALVDPVVVPIRPLDPGPYASPAPGSPGASAEASRVVRIDADIV